MLRAPRFRRTSSENAKPEEGDQQAEHRGEEQEQQPVLPPKCTELRVHPPKQFIPEIVDPPVDGFKSGIDGFESGLDDFESGIDAGPQGVDLRGQDVDPATQARLNLSEAALNRPNLALKQSEANLDLRDLFRRRKPRLAAIDLLDHRGRHVRVKRTSSSEDAKPEEGDQQAEHRGEEQEQQPVLPPKCTELRVHPPKQFIPEIVDPPVDGFESGIDGFESGLDDFESGIDAGPQGVDLRGQDVDPATQARLNLSEAALNRPNLALKQSEANLDLRNLFRRRKPRPAAIDLLDHRGRHVRVKSGAHQSG